MNVIGSNGAVLSAAYMSPTNDIPYQEYRALRDTIRERGSLRFLVVVITFVAWAGLATVVSAWIGAGFASLIPLVVLAAGFEVVFAVHVGVERIGRYIQARFETGDLPAGWEHAAMRAGEMPGAGTGVDALFAAHFAAAVVLNCLLAGFDDSRLEGRLTREFALLALAHAALLLRILQARRFARSQRQRDLELFAHLLAPPRH